MGSVARSTADVAGASAAVRDSQRGKVYSAEHLVHRIFDRSADYPVVEIAGSRLTLPPERRFGSIEEGVGYAQEVGFGEIIGRGEREAEALPSELVYAGFSLGVVPAQKLAQTRDGARGALFFYSCVPPSEFGAWPADVPAQIHGMDADPIFVEEGDIDAAREVVEAADDGELFLYPGDQHYFADSSLPSYDEGATKLLTERVLAFLGSRG